MKDKHEIVDNWLPREHVGVLRRQESRTWACELDDSF